MTAMTLAAALLSCSTVMGSAPSNWQCKVRYAQLHPLLTVEWSDWMVYDEALSAEECEAQAQSIVDLEDRRNAATRGWYKFRQADGTIVKGSVRPHKN